MRYIACRTDTNCDVHRITLRILSTYWHVESRFTFGNFSRKERKELFSRKGAFSLSSFPRRRNVTLFQVDSKNLIFFIKVPVQFLFNIFLIFPRYQRKKQWNLQLKMHMILLVKRLFARDVRQYCDLVTFFREWNDVLRPLQAKIVQK